MSWAACGRSGDNLGLSGQAGRRSWAGGSPETIAGDTGGAGEQCGNPQSFQWREEQCMQRRYRVSFHTHPPSPPHLFPLILNLPALRVSSAVASQTPSRRANTGSSDVCFTHYETPSQPPCLTPASITQDAQREGGLCRKRGLPLTAGVS